MENNWGIGTTNWGKFSSRTPGAAPVWSPHFHFFLFLKMDLVWWWSSQGRCHAVTQAGVYFTSGTHCQRLETLIVLFRCPKDLHKKSFNLTFFFFSPTSIWQIICSNDYSPTESPPKGQWKCYHGLQDSRTMSETQRLYPMHTSDKALLVSRGLDCTFLNCGSVYSHVNLFV